MWIPASFADGKGSVIGYRSENDGQEIEFSFCPVAKHAYGVRRPVKIGQNLSK
jgi:hypothetical protein